MPEFLVGAVFELDTEQAQAGLARMGETMAGLADMMTEMVGQGERLFAGLRGALDSAVTAVGNFSTAFTSAFARIDEAAATAVRSIEGVSGALATADREAVARGEMLPPLRGAEGGERGEALRRAEDLERGEIARRGEARGGAGEIWGLIDSVLLYSAVHSATSEQQSLFRGVQAFGLDPTTAEGQEAMRKLQKAAADAAMNTSYKEYQTAAGIPVLARPFNLEGMKGVDDLVNIYANAAKAAEGLELLNPKNTFEESLSAMVEYAHLSRVYDPAKLKGEYDILGAITQLTPKTTFAAEAGAAAYLVPMARAGGMTAEHATILMGALQQAGLRGTVAATTLRQELLGLTKTGGPMQSHQMREDLREFERELSLRDPDAAKAFKGDLHIQTMKEVGLLDAKGQKTFLYSAEDEAAGRGTKGGVDIDKANRIIAAWASTHDPADVQAMEFRLFGARGEQAAALLAIQQKLGEPDYIKNYEDRVLKEMKTEGGYLEHARDIMSKTQGQEFGQVWARLTDIVTHLADATLPAFKTALENAILPTLNFIEKALQPGPGGPTGWQQTLGGGLIGALAGGTIGGLIGLFTGGPVGGMVGAGTGALRGAGVGLGTFGAYNLYQFMRDHPELASPEFGGLPIGSELPYQGVPSMTIRPGAATAAPQPQPQSSGVTVNLGPVTMQGVPDDSSLVSLYERLISGIRSALTTSSETAHGTSLSPYTQGYGF